ncbi:hypothetical protein THAOC_07229, partial [Thalassiosira oceanica]
RLVGQRPLELGALVDLHEADAHEGLSVVRLEGVESVERVVPVPPLAHLDEALGARRRRVPRPLTVAGVARPERLGALVAEEGRQLDQAPARVAVDDPAPAARGRRRVGPGEGRRVALEGGRRRRLGLPRPPVVAVCCRRTRLGGLDGRAWLGWLGAAADALPV